METNPNLPRTIPLAAIEVPRQRARNVELDDRVRELASSSRQIGLLHPVQVRDLGGGKYSLIAGKRRLLAHTVLGEETILATIQPYLEDDSQRSLLDRLIEVKENLDRQELTPIEIAQHLVEQERLLEALHMRAKRGQAARHHGLKTTADLAREHGVSARTYRERTAVGQLPEPVLAAAQQVGTVRGKWSELRELTRFDDEGQALAALDLVAAGEATSVAEARARLEAPVAVSTPDTTQENEASRHEPAPEHEGQLVVWETMSSGRWHASFRLALEGLGRTGVLVTPAPVGDQLADVARMVGGLSVRHQAWVIVALEPYAIWSARSALWPDDVMDLDELRELLGEALV